MCVTHVRDNTRKEYREIVHDFFHDSFIPLPTLIVPSTRSSFAATSASKAWCFWTFPYDVKIILSYVSLNHKKNIVLSKTFHYLNVRRILERFIRSCLQFFTDPSFDIIHISAHRLKWLRFAKFWSTFYKCFL